MAEPIVVMPESLFANMQQSFVTLHGIGHAVPAELAAAAVYSCAVLESERIKGMPCNKTDNKWAAENWDGRVSAAIKKA
ncbi:hypothetical protein [Paenibacillus sp. MMS18-CY102]|uniref:hypothetical protein n=1 Tax=Paenibacillus sp. MMS18-CY102 TaxID=2682849 RepID=UPI001365CDCC|nr:hypothetical protein [Paenibacillus sp. MMS18-CY102]MWC27463.1 hypothetical protein [Paenibacillus sp. MMS18-CY102]